MFPLLTTWCTLLCSQLHTDDCGECDFRLARVPPTDASKPSPVLRFTNSYPREVSTRSPTYVPHNLDEQLPPNLLETWRTAEWTANQTLGLTPALGADVAAALGVSPPNGQTYGTIEGLYSIINSEQVAIAESTAQQTALLPSKVRPNANVGGPYATKRDGGLYDIAALTRVALARCPTARCAIDLMGYLATSEGYYAALPEYSGETLLVADPLEAWSFQIAPLPPNASKAAGVEGAGDGGHSAVWVAQRVPDDHFTVVANRFTVRDVVEVAPDAATPLTLACRGDDFRHSSNLFAVASLIATIHPNPQPLEQTPPDELGVRTTQAGPRVVDWTTTFGGDKAAMAYYTNGRVWRVLSLLAPDVTWEWPPPTPLATGTYPFSMKPSKLLTRDDFLALVRDVYKGAGQKYPFSAKQLDLTTGMPAGPYGDVSRYDIVPAVGAGGFFPRAISMFRTSYSHVTEIGRRDGALVGARIWASQGAPHASMYTPLHVMPASLAPADAARNKVANMPPSYTQGSLHRADVFDADPTKASIFWRSTMVNNWARAVGYDFAWESILQAQRQVDAEALAAAEEAEEAAAQAASPTEAAALLADADRRVAARSAVRHRELVAKLMTTLHDGYRMDPSTPKLNLTKLFYPRWWLAKVGYYQDEYYQPLAARLHVTAGIALPGAASRADDATPVWAVGAAAFALFVGGVAIGAVGSRRVQAASNWPKAVPAVAEDEASDHYFRIGA